MGQERRRYSFVDEETGELVEYIEWRLGDTLRTKRQNEFFFDQMERYADKTEFIWVKFAYNKDFYASIKPVNLTRLMYFATFCNDACYVMQNSDVRSMLNVNNNQLKEFRDEFFEKIIIKDGKRLYLKESLFGKGKIDESEKDYIRLFTGPTRQLYENCKKTSEHAYLSYLFRMMPFVNRQTNILCCSQEEQDKENLDKYIM